MELFLNILWVAIAVGALGVWRIVWRRQPRRSPHKPLQEWTAFTCALVFVFFAVSLSDDLQAATILAEDCASGRHHSLVWSCGHASHPGAGATHTSLPAAPSTPFLGPLQIVSRIAPATFVFCSGAGYSHCALRGPPALPY